MTQCKVLNLMVNYRTNPLGVDDLNPRLSWQIQAETRGFIQFAYQIQAGCDPSFEAEAELVWDTGKVVSDSSVHIEYQGRAMHPRTRYFFRVRIWASEDDVSAWSAPAYWETALLSTQNWQAGWITAPVPGQLTENSEDPCDYFRTEFELPAEAVSARIYATSLGLYRLYVNGIPADDTLFSPGWTSYNKRLQYQTYDVSRMLTAGGNTLGCIVGNGWYKGYLAWDGSKDHYGKQRALLVQLHVTLADGTEQIIVTDGSWRTSTGPLLMSELYHGETYDARLEPDGWASPGFADHHWKQAALTDAPPPLLVAQENEPARIVETIKPIEVITTPAGATVLDMGQNMVGWVRFTVKAEAGTEVTLQHAEVLDRDGNFYTGNLRSARQTVTYICRGGEPETFEPHFTFQGFRYVQVTDVPRDQLVEQFTGCVIHSDLEQTGSFSCSDELVNRLQHNILWGQKGNFLDVPTDCPQRDERLGWTGDAQVFIRTAAFNMNVVPFFEKWLKDLAADQEADGRVPHVIPDIRAAGYGSSAWGDAAVICPWTLYQCYGDVRILKQQYPSMKAWVEYIRAQGEHEFLWNTGHHFGDWLGLDAKENSYIGATPKDLIATAFFAYSTELLAKTAEIIGQQEEAEKYRELHSNIIRAFREEFVTPSGRVASPTQTAYAVALMFDLLEEKDRPRTAAMLADHVKENGTHLTTGFVGTPYLCLVLSRFGYTDLAYELVLQKEYPSWLYSVLQGATTIWEHWDGIKQDGSFWSDDMNSYNHYAYGAVGDWLYRIAGGIELIEPGYKKIRIQPQPGRQLTWAEASYSSVYGPIQSAWSKQSDGSLELKITIPANTTAELILPLGQRGKMLESGKALNHVSGVLSAEENAGVRKLTIGSGNYRFTIA
ncbi:MULTISPECIES: glycoside hydrolase family 78 protein [unclassified Paenibacillus]|uniref:glycoside hydrolase family 78 protein n=1 Tax=unclassified Paenibacillus TaxID=185978 RepID=UPI0024054F5F|nr:MULTISPECIES: glycoside hydrolase family 78 protein [unclassified Paenibacillus]MDF9841666.1 alpha-L-rhamnosidase [Paenibacillus sp. PastF-2]MDF9848222.1 alpha-L-rhamnosidase [Paenibacillus sp. PastM-2]MDF9854825.1 alpha-L-rhamnosidase [Paenibacillus sp. PastF-1]MDH6480095.1 alpha-L-rhamnosidase [Paenibacillus sp. PastH-2]MDH6507528.1 alpha-L-rhamnosidase [Paenibacillus sp. PastM-3]